MTILSEAFDQHAGVSYNDISHLYWGKFPFKVVLPFEFPLPADRIVSGKREKETTKILSKTVLPAEGNVFKKIITAKGIQFFFEDAEIACQFVSDNVSLVGAVYRPRDETQISLLSDRKIRLREILYWGKYRWCITFSANRKAEQEDETDSWITEHFDHEDNGEGRYMYCYANSRKLYLIENNDAIAVRIALSDQIKSIEYCILHEDNENQNEFMKTQKVA